MYWIDISQKKIWQANLNGTQVVTILDGVVEEPGMAPLDTLGET